MHLILLNHPSLHLPLHLLWLTSPSLFSSNHLSIPHPPSVIRHTYPTAPLFLPHHLFRSIVLHPTHLHSPYLHPSPYPTPSSHCLTSLSPMLSSRYSGSLLLCHTNSSLTPLPSLFHSAYLPHPPTHFLLSTLTSNLHIISSVFPHFSFPHPSSVPTSHHVPPTSFPLHSLFNHLSFSYLSPHSHTSMLIPPSTTSSHYSAYLQSSSPVHLISPNSTPRTFPLPTCLSYLPLLFV